MPTSTDLQTFLLAAAFRIGGALLVLLVGRWLAARARAWIAPLVARTHLTGYLAEVLVRGAYYGVLAGAALIALATIGVPVTALVGSIGVATVVLGLALQESISNFAATIIFFVFQPFEVGDIIETNGVTAQVAEVQILSTILHKADGKVIILPNGKIQENGVVNYSKKPVLRTDVKVGVSYDADLSAVRTTALALMGEDERILADPPPRVIVDELGDSSVQVELRAFVKGADYWQVGWDLTERVHAAFPAAGIEIPYPQVDVHIAESENKEAESPA